jgi:transposase InsO family protein
MSEQEREELALFRYGVISDFLHRDWAWGERKRLLERKALELWRHPKGEPVRVSQETLRSWLRRYRREGIDGLKPKRRKDQGQTRALAEPLRQALWQLRQAHPEWGVPELVRQLRQSGLVSAGEALSLSTLYRLVGRRQLGEEPVKADRRKYGFEQLLACVQADVMYGPRVRAADGQRRRSYLHLLLDDSSRLVLAGEFCWNERTAAFQQVLRRALERRRYVPERLYTDNGAAFVSHQLQWVCAQLGIKLLHSRPGQPEGRGKIERLFRTIQEQFLVTAWREEMTLEALNAAFWEWVELEYHRQPHQGLAGQTPLQIWTQQASQLGRLARAPEPLDRLFRHRAQRRVGKDRVVQLGGKLYQAPVALIGEKVELLYDPENLSQVEVRWQQKSYGWIQPVALAANRQLPRGLRFDREVDHA